MHKKIGDRRRATFLRALEASGNVTLAAERAKVSRGWVLKARRTEPEFDAACRAALAAAKARLAQAEGREPASGWGFLDGEELVVKGCGGPAFGRRVQITRARLKQWTPRVEDRFLATLGATCNVRAASSEVGMTAASAYGHRKRWAGFAERWDRAIEDGYARIEMGLVENAQNLFSEAELPPETPMTEMTAAHAIHMLHMHKHQVKKLGKAPGKGWREPPTLDDPGMREGILAKLECFERKRGMSEEERAERQRAEREWERRRGVS